MKIESKRDKREGMARFVGTDQPSVFDVVNRDDFESDDAYLDAVTKVELERMSPEYQAVRRRLSREYAIRNEKAERELQKAAYQEIRANIKLDHLDKRAIDTEASAMARRDLASGKITASQLGTKIEEYASQLTNKRKDEKASNQLINAMIRGGAAERGDNNAW